MASCSVCKRLKVAAGCIDDYRRLAHYHYRDSHLGPYTAIFALRGDSRLAGTSRTITAGVIVYSTASAVLELRNIATDNFFAGLDKGTQLALMNRDIRRISRVIVEPRFRGLGLASRLVRETMPELNVPIVEAVAVMGLVNPFLERAGMKAYTAPLHAGSVRLIEALSMIGIETDQLIDPRSVQRTIDQLSPEKSQFLERQIRYFLRSHGRRRDMSPGLERTRYILTRLTARPTYYIWFNPEFDNGCSIADSRRESGKESA
ncbi:MAG: hypothetical protein ABIF19_07270 [Planctomycetota bacterium]